MIKDIQELVKSVNYNVGYLRAGGNGVRWPRTWHHRMFVNSQVEIVEHQIKEVIRYHPLVSFLTKKKKDHVIRVELGNGVIWLNVFSVHITDDPDSGCRELYNPWKGKDGTYLYTLSADGLLKNGKRYKNAYWLDQAPLLTVAVKLDRNVSAFLANHITEKEGSDVWSSQKA